MSETDETGHGLGEVDGLGDEAEQGDEGELEAVAEAETADEVLAKPGKAKRVDPAAEQEAERAMQRRWELVAELAELSGIHPDDEVKPCPVCQMGVVPILMQQDPTAERCPACAGIGVVNTGSLIDDHAIRPCESCHGKGFRQVVQLAPAPAELAQVAEAFTPDYPPLPQGVA